MYWVLTFSTSILLPDSLQTLDFKLIEDKDYIMFAHENSEPSIDLGA